MNRITPSRALWSGLALIALVNAIALGGAAWNRSKDESRLALSERELRPPMAWEANDEDSSVRLHLQWRVDSEDGFPLYGYLSGRSRASWLTPARLAALGFAMDPPAADAPRAPRERVREVVVVLELDGPARAQALARQQEDAAAKRREANAAPASPSLAEQATELERQFARERDHGTRLYIVDLGRDPAALRARYPDQGRYALLPALLELSWQRDEHRQWRASAWLERLLAGDVTLSRSQALALGPALAVRRTSHEEEPTPPFSVDWHVGRRLEPWAASVQAPR